METIVTLLATQITEAQAATKVAVAERDATVSELAKTKDALRESRNETKSAVRARKAITNRFIKTSVDSAFLKTVVMPLMTTHAFAEWQTRHYVIRVRLGATAVNGEQIDYGFKIKQVSEGRYKICAKFAGICHPIPEFVDADGKPACGKYVSTYDEIVAVVDTIAASLPNHTSAEDYAAKKEQINAQLEAKMETLGGASGLGAFIELMRRARSAQSDDTK